MVNGARPRIHERSQDQRAGAIVQRGHAATVGLGLKRDPLIAEIGDVYRHDPEEDHELRPLSGVPPEEFDVFDHKGANRIFQKPKPPIEPA